MPNASDYPNNARHHPPLPDGKEEQGNRGRYLRTPGRDFYQPWLATPGGSAFIWPLSVEGFNFSSSASTGIHKYLDSKGVDVDIVYGDEFHLSLNGIFPGYTAKDNLHALREVITDRPDKRKILCLPLLFDQFQYVKVVDHSFTHAEDDFGYDINYGIEFIREGAGGTIKLPKLPTWSPSPSTAAPKGASSRTTKVTQAAKTLKTIAHQVYGDVNKWQRLYQLNISWFNSNGVTQHQAPFKQLPLGLSINY